jgi:aryl-alcohol dehydrogenase-like predicted oxidoreductase
MSKLAIGTYLGNFSDEDSVMYRESLEYALENGINHIDTAVNYRGMRSERDIGIVLKKMMAAGKIQREDVIISTKAGFIPGDGEIMLKPVDYLEKHFIETGILSDDDIHINRGLRLTLNPKYYEYAIKLSLEHMCIDYIDIHYIHEPELKKEMIGEDLFYQSIENLFKFYESQVEKGVVKSYGLATWDSFQMELDDPKYISLEKVVNIAKSVTPKHSFKHIMLPYNLVMDQANTKRTQLVNNKLVTAFEAAKLLNLQISTSGSINRASDREVRDFFIDNKKNPHIDWMIVGMKQLKHLKENIKLFNES